MPPVDERKLFRDDKFNPEVFSVEERRYIAEHIGDKPSVMNEDPPPAGANIPTLRVALQRFFDDDEIDHEQIRGSIDRSLKLYERRQQARAQFGSIPWKQLGVGLGTGQSRMLKANEVRLSPKFHAPESFFDDVLSEQQKAELVSDPRVVQEMFRVECGFCPEGDRYYYQGRRVQQAMGAHMRQVHKDHQREWKALSHQVRKLQRAGEMKIVIAGPDGIAFRERPTVEDDD